MADMSIETANAELDDSDFERWKKVREKNLKDQADENRQKWAERDEEAIDTLIKSGRNDLTTTVNIFGGEYEFFVSLDREQRQIFNKIKDKRELAKSENMDIENVDGISDLVIDFLSSISKDFNREDWEKLEGELGFVGLYDVFIKVMKVFKSEMDEKQEAVKKFRNG